MSKSFSIGQLVWGKMKGFPAWPGLISEPTPEVKKGAKASPNSWCIFFFGSNNYSWLDEKCLQHYNDAKETCSKANKTVAFLEACKAAEEYITSGAKGVPVKAEETPTKKKKETKRKSSISDSGEVTSPAKKPKTKDNKITPDAGKQVSKLKSENDNFATPKGLGKKKKSVMSATLNFDDRESTYYKSPRMSLIDRPSHCEPEIITTDVKVVSQCLKKKNIIASTKTIGFLGLGIMGSRVAKNILQSGHKVMLWNRTPEKCEQFVAAGAEVGLTPADVVQRSDITFSCVSDPTAAKELVFGNCGVLSEIKESKGFIELTSIDSDTSTDIADNINMKGGRYLEAQMVGSMKEAEEGQLIFLCAGDKTLFDDCESCFRACSGHTPYFLGRTGSATNMNLVFQIINSIAVAGLAEGFSLAKRLCLPIKDLIAYLKLSSVNCELFSEKLEMMEKEKFPTSLPLQHSQKDMKLALALGEQLNQALPLTATVNEIYKHARRLGLGTHDSSSVYIRAIKY